MNYLIEDIILYSDDDGSIRNVSQDEDEHPMLLTPVPNRILSLLLANQGNLVTHETFYIEVWDRYGKSGSSNSLKQYIGVIRKLLKKNSGKECIITVPGKGYLFPPDIHVSSQIEDAPVLLKHEGFTLSPGKCRLKNPLENKRIHVYILLLFSVITVIFLLYREIYRADYLVSENLKKLTSIKNCPVFSLSSVILKDSDYYQQDIERLFAENKMTCDKDDIFYYFTSVKDKKNEINSYSILSKCSSDNANDICMTFRATR